ncbi:MAG: helix-turn-helix transcriptional regulator [Bacteroidaceae bacterium]|nr:helix-turn-helix transcriptional regulator [Bacteroidaceae bacterium]
MTRQELITSPAYITAHLQIELYGKAEEFMKKHGMNRTKLAEHLGVSKGYITQLLNGDFDHRISKFVELATKFGYVPVLQFQPIESFQDFDLAPPSNVKYLTFPLKKSTSKNDDYSSSHTEIRYA